MEGRENSKVKGRARNLDFILGGNKKKLKGPLTGKRLNLWLKVVHLEDKGMFVSLCVPPYSYCTPARLLAVAADWQDSNPCPSSAGNGCCNRLVMPGSGLLGRVLLLIGDACHGLLNRNNTVVCTSHVCHLKVKGLLLLRENPPHPPAKGSRMDPGLRQIRVQIWTGLHLPCVILGKSLPVTELHSLLCKEWTDISPSWSCSVDCVERHV